MEIKRLLEQRKRAKKSKPVFVVKESKFVSRVKSRWRFPRGMHSAVRQRHRGRPPLPAPGYGAPKAVKGLHQSGLEPIVVKNESELLALNKEKQGAILSRTLGGRKRLGLLQLTQENKITLLQVRDPAALIKKISEEFAMRKKIKQDKTAEKSKKTEEKQKKAKEKEKKEQEEKESKKKEESISDEEQNQAEENQAEEYEQRKMMEKMITKRQ